jgi:hypothetical protein
MSVISGFPGPGRFARSGRVTVVDGHYCVWDGACGPEAAKRLSGWWSYGLGTGCWMMSSVLVTVFALMTTLRPNPWYDPPTRYRSSV